MACHVVINWATECLEPCKISLKVTFFFILGRVISLKGRRVRRYINEPYSLKRRLMGDLLHYTLLPNYVDSIKFLANMIYWENSEHVNFPYRLLRIIIHSLLIIFIVVIGCFICPFHRIEMPCARWEWDRSHGIWAKWLTQQVLPVNCSESFRDFRAVLNYTAFIDHNRLCVNGASG